MFLLVWNSKPTSFYDLLKEKTTNLLVLVSGRVAYATTFNSKDGDLLGVVFENTVIFGQALKVGTSLTFVGEAVRDKAGNLMIQKSKEQSLIVFSEESSFDEMVNNMKSQSELCVILAKIFGSIAVAIAVVYGVDYARKVLLPFVWKKKDLGESSSQNGSSDSEDTDLSDF
ncbi:E3 Ubiquitin ligase GIDE-type [Arabidopsis suecica]|uniref:RING-type E3 ubiquitin transferase n=1 Tax=Arabidopsis suecica TaxID=45249 RepID=A0A8T2H2E2_ARASU|nr:E3 Ubiquitin ligase GIDE-type [Arabidopsis suecica]